MKKSFNNKLLYVASLYATGAKNKQTLNIRYKRVLQATTLLLKNGYYAFSPIVHNHPINLGLKENPGWDFWEPYDKNILKRCDCMVILADEGWEISIGINAEIEYARELYIPIYLMYIKDSREIVFEKYNRK